MKRRILGLLSVGLLAFTMSTVAAETTRVITRDAIIAKYGAPESRFVDLDGVNVHYRDEGKGPAVLLVHGTLGDLQDWNEWADILKKDYRVIRLDLPGFGLSADMPNKNHSVDRMHTLIDSLMDHLGVEKFAIVGISYGGMVSFRYASTRTERVTAMVLINSAGIEAGKAAQPKDGAPKPKPGYDLFTSPQVATEDVLAFYTGYINDPARRSPAFIQRKLDLLNVTGRDEIGRIARGLYERGNPERVLSHVRAPSLVIWGEENHALFTKTAEAFVAALKNACPVELVTFKKGGHYINVERPEETAQAAKAFLDRVLSPSGKGTAACPPRAPR